MFSAVSFSSSLSVRGMHGRIGGSLSVLDSAMYGSSLSVRAFTRMGSDLSALGKGQVKGRVSIFDYSNCGSSLSIRAIGKYGSSMSMAGGYFWGGSSMSVRGFLRVGGALSVMKEMVISSSMSIPEVLMRLKMGQTRINPD